MSCPVGGADAFLPQAYPVQYLVVIEGGQAAFLEQMLSGHPDVHGAGELPLFGELAHGALAAPGAEREARLADLAAAPEPLPA